MSSLTHNVATQKSSLSLRWLSPFWLTLIALIGGAVTLRAALMDNFPLSPDEGIHLMWLRLLSAGYAPYSEVYITYPPLYPLAIQTVWDIWPTEIGQRWFSVVYTMFGVVGIALIARRWAGPLAGIVAAGLTLFSPVLVEPSRAVLGEFPSVVWSVWAVWLAWLYLDAESTWTRRGLVILSGLCLSASLLTKLLSPFMGALLPLMLLSRWLPGRITPPAPPKGGGKSQAGPPAPPKGGEKSDDDSTPSQPPPFDRLRTQPARGRSQNFPPSGGLGRPREPIPSSGGLGGPLKGIAFKSLLTDLALWTAALILPALLLFAIYDVGPLVQQVVAQRLQARAAYTADDAFWPPRYERGSMFVAEDPALVLLGLVGLGVALTVRQRRSWILGAWVGLALLMLAIHNPIRYKHFLILIPPFAILGGWLISHWLTTLRTWWVAQQKTVGHSLYAIGGAFFLLSLTLWQVQTARTVWQAKAAVPQPPTDEVEALAFITEMTAPDDCLITDDMQLVYWSERMVPPELAEVSSNRLKSGALTLAELIAVSDAYDCQLVAAVSNRIPKFLPDYMDWVESKYLGRFRYGEDDLFFAKIDTGPNPNQPLWANFDQQFIFHGYSLPPTARRGQRVPLTLIWQAHTEPATDYAIFVQLRDEANHTLVSADHQPYGGLLPTSTWPAGAVIQEVTWLDLPPDLPPGHYPIYVGLYDPTTLERLPLLDDASGENSLILGPLSVQ